MTVTAEQDDDGENASVTITHTVSGYGSIVRAASVTVTVDDDETPNVSVSEPSLTFAEGGSDTYTVVLDTQPLTRVTVTPSSDNSDVTVTPVRLAFTTTTWAMAQTVTVAGRDDGDADDDTATVTHTVSGYGSITTADSVDITVTDPDIPNVSISKPSLVIDEGESDTYMVVLDTQPAANVTVGITSDNPEVTTNTGQLRFTETTWNRAQTVTVAAADDGDDQNDSATISHSVSGYGSIVTAANIDVTVNDLDDPGVSISEPSLEFDEGASGTYTVVLDTEPGGSVTVGVSSDNAEVPVSPTSLTFTTTDWSNPQAVTVTAERDGDDADETATISHSVMGYGSIVTADSVDVTVTDLDIPGVSVSKPSLQISEGGMDTYTVVLDTEPGVDVTVTTASTNPDVTVFPVNLTFTVVNWAEPQIVTVTAAEDADSTNDTARVSHAVSGYGSVTTGPNVGVTVRDNEARTPSTPTEPPRQPSGTSGSGTSGSGTGSAPQGAAPSFTEGVNTTRTVRENAEAGTPVGDPLQATDPDSPSVTYSLDSIGNDRESFSIDRLTGQLRTRVVLDYETKSRYYLIVRAFSDDGSAGIRVIVEVTNDPTEPGEATPPSVTEPTATPVPEPTATPTPEPTAATPTPEPTAATPTPEPTATPTPEPTATIPTREPTATPTTPTPEPAATPAPEAAVTPTPKPTAAAIMTPVPIVEPPDEGGGLPVWVWALIALMGAGLVTGGIAYTHRRR